MENILFITINFILGGFTVFNGNPLDFYRETLEEACARAGVVSNELNIWKLWADKGLQPYADFFKEIQNYL